MEVFNAGKKYNVIYAYPPWSFKTYLEKGKDRSAERHYPTMKKEDIQALPRRLRRKTACYCSG